MKTLTVSSNANIFCKYEPFIKLPEQLLETGTFFEFVNLKTVTFSKIPINFQNPQIVFEFVNNFLKIPKKIKKVEIFKKIKK